MLKLYHSVVSGQPNHIIFSMFRSTSCTHLEETRYAVYTEIKNTEFEFKKKKNQTVRVSKMIAGQQFNHLHASGENKHKVCRGISL